ncbi:MAG: hypothetical protein E7176_00170 [Erysipelotrichaceae bacterium]|nr:hypothetical protein [Erysipelotrichaceae bacterium]
MKKRKLLVGLLAASAAIGLASCDKDKSVDEPTNDSTNQDDEVTSYTVTFNSVGGSNVAKATTNADGKVAKPADPSKEGYTFGGWYTDAEYKTVFNFDTKLTANTTLYAKWVEVAATTYTVQFYVGDTQFGDDVIVEEEDLVAFPNTNPTDPYKNFAGWVTESGASFSASTPIMADTKLYAKWEKRYEPVTVEFSQAMFKKLSGKSFSYANFDFGYTGNAPTDKNGTMTIKTGKSTKITVTEVATLRFSALSGSDNPAKQWVGLVRTHDADGNELATPEKITVNNEEKIVITKSFADYEFANLQPGTYFLTAANSSFQAEESGEAGLTYYDGSGGTTQFAWISLTSDKEVGPVEKIETGITCPKFDYLLNEDYNLEQLAIDVIYENQRIDAIGLEDVTIIGEENIDKTTEGTYTLTVEYTHAVDGLKKTTTIDVNYYTAQSLDLAFNKVEKVANNTWGNGVYFNQTVQQLYKMGSNATIDLDALTATITAKNGEDEAEFVRPMNATDNIIGYDVSAAGKVTVTVKYIDGITNTFDIQVVNTEPVITNNTVQLIVNPDYEGQLALTSDGKHQFNNIQQALEYLELYKVGSNVTKEIYLTAGTYNEKVEVTLPNVHIIGADKATTKIEFDALYGQYDESGFVHVTDSTATISVRDTAIGFVLEGVTVSNKWDTLKDFDDEFGENYGEHRALAMLIQADQVIVKNASLTGYQDTLELMSGRQYFENVLITGTTDFIFGTNNTTVFENCEIRSIESGKDSTQGGYITAFKGNNKNANDATKYGVIFNNCNFTADDAVQAYGDKDAEENDLAGWTAIARPWANYSVVTVMNSQLGAHISKDGYNGDSKNRRYVTGLIKEFVNTVKNYEYNNTGVGAITEAVEGMSFLTADQAAEFGDLSKVFAANTALGLKSDWIISQNHQDTYKLNFQVVYDSAIGIETSTVQALLPSVLSYTNEFALPESVDVKGAKLEGYYTDAECTIPFDGTTYTIADTDAENANESNATIYVKFVDYAVTVTYNLNSGSIDGIVDDNSDGVVTAPVTKEDGNAELHTPTRDGYVFAGWTETETTGEPNTDIKLFKVDTKTGLTEDITLYAVWLELHTVSFDGTIVDALQTAWTNTAATVDEGTGVATIPTNKIAPNDGTGYTSSNYIDAVKLGKANSSNISTTFTNPIKKATLNLVIGNNGSGNAQDDVVVIEGYDSTGNVVATLKVDTLAGKITDYLTLNDSKDLVLESDAADIVKIAVYTTYSKDLGVYSIDVKYTDFVDMKYDVEEVVETVTNNYSFDYSAIDTTKLTKVDQNSDSVVDESDTYDKAQINNATFAETANSFLTVGDSTKVTYRTSGSCIETKDDNLTVTFVGTGTITISFASTGGSNISALGLKDSEGNWIAGTTTDATLIAEGVQGGKTGSLANYTAEEYGAYSVTGSTYVTVTFTIEEAGTYTISAPSTTNGRGTRINSIVMVDNYAE